MGIEEGCLEVHPKQLMTRILGESVTAFLAPGLFGVEGS
jgi:hypothetical protein